MVACLVAGVRIPVATQEQIIQTAIDADCVFAARAIIGVMRHNAIKGMERM